TQTSRKVEFRKYLRYAAVFLPLILLSGMGVYWANHHGKNRSALQPDSNKGSLAGIHILPKGKVAQLILGNGAAVALNGNRKEYITEKDGTKVQNGGDELSYSKSEYHKGQVIYNTLLIPRGGEYAVTLSDGTKVWLNAGSSLHFPTQFGGKEREVFLTGEAYFEVAEDAAHPFIVEAGNMDVTVLGTRFDITSYSDDPHQKTILAEGSVRITRNGKESESVVLTPGYEAVLSKGENTIQVNPANVTESLAWKNGMFVFDGESLGSLMRKLSRWYDVNVRYEGGVDTMFHFTGRIKRYENITGILDLIELTGKVSFAVKNHELYVSQNK
ncbi:MAG: FecR family protein, partial [Chitinophagaceae bacterium]